MQRAIKKFFNFNQKRKTRVQTKFKCVCHICLCYSVLLSVCYDHLIVSVSVSQCISNLHREQTCLGSSLVAKAGTAYEYEMKWQSSLCKPKICISAEECSQKHDHQNFLAYPLVVHHESEPQDQAANESSTSLIPSSLMVSPGSSCQGNPLI